jgi:hypothetical protein
MATSIALIFLHFSDNNQLDKLCAFKSQKEALGGKLEIITGHLV